MFKISPSILSADFTNLERDIAAAVDGGADYIHVDVMDGHFVPNITIGVPVVESISRAFRCHPDVHLMIDEPNRYADAFIDAGAGILTFHVEAPGIGEVSHASDLLKHIRSRESDQGLPLSRTLRLRPLRSSFRSVT